MFNDILGENGMSIWRKPAPRAKARVPGSCFARNMLDDVYQTNNKQKADFLAGIVHILFSPGT